MLGNLPDVINDLDVDFAEDMRASDRYQHDKRNIRKVQEATKTVNVKDQQAEEAMGTIRSTVTEIQESIKISFTSWSDEVRQSVEEMAKQMELSATADVATVRSNQCFKRRWH